VEIDRDGIGCLRVATNEAKHRDNIIFIMAPAKPGEWRVDAGSVPAAAGDDVFIFRELTVLLCRNILHIRFCIVDVCRI